jgi:poly(U)-specific endoribonuclease
MYDNHEAPVTRSEVVTDAERAEENAFINAVMRTDVMQRAYNFLKREGLAPASEVDFKRNLRDIWFGIYNRQRNTPSSSGFEHVFLGEIKNGEVSGFHNWLYFLDQEAQNKANYLGWQKTLSLGKVGYISSVLVQQIFHLEKYNLYLFFLSWQSGFDLLKNGFVWNGVAKNSSSMFVGTSPEFEMSLYTVCFYARPNQRCPMEIGGKTFDVKTFREVDQKLGKAYVGSAFPQF